MSSVSPRTQTERWLSDFNAALADQNIARAGDLFEPHALWRDLVSFTWNIHTADGRNAIEHMLRTTLSHVRPGGFRIVAQPTIKDGVVEAQLSFATSAGSGLAMLRLRDGRCWTLFTTLRQLHGHEEKTAANANRELGISHGAVRGRVPWQAQRARELEELGNKQRPYCLVVGAGQGGLALGARLRRLGVPTVIVEKNARPGDSWRNRYNTLCLHDPVWYDHLPYLPFPEHWPIFSPKDQLGDWLEMYANIMDLNVWCNTTCIGASFDEEHSHWNVTLEQDGHQRHLQPTHFILATGMSGAPHVPHITGSRDFAGTVLHSSEYRSGEAFAGKRCVVVGANTSAHDICADLWECGAHTTMVQRSPTIVVRSETMSDLVWGPLYSEDALANGISTDTADLLVASTPAKITPPRLAALNRTIRQQDAALYDGLESVGFQYDFGEDGTGIGGAYPRRGGGYYIDVGASQLIIDKEIALKGHTNIKHLHASGLVFTDGSSLAADLIVFATGYGPMNQWAERLISPEVGHRVGRCWGLGSGFKGDPGPWEGELRNMWKPTQQPNLWFHGGNLMQSRFYSALLALQLKARFENMQTPVYALPQANHS